MHGLPYEEAFHGLEIRLWQPPLAQGPNCVSSIRAAYTVCVAGEAADPFTTARTRKNLIRNL